MAREKETKGQEYNAQGSKEEGEVHEDKAEFGKGGKTRRKLKKGGAAKHHVEIESKHEGEGNVIHHHHHYKEGGKAEGKKTRERADRPRRASGGRTPYSSGSVVTKPEMDHNSGHEDERPPEKDG